MHITLSNVTKRFGGIVALDDVSLQIAAGQIVAVLGANGAGKTTLLRALGGIVTPDQGEVRYDSHVFRRDRLDIRRRFCLLPDFPEVFRQMTVLEHLGMVVQVYETDQTGLDEKLVALLSEFNILPLIDAPLGTLSRGQLYKAALIGLLAVDPEVWLLDEPFASGMDPPGIGAFRRHARSAAARGRTIVYTTQIVELAERFSDRVCVLQDGRLAAFDALDHIRRAAAGDDGMGALLGGASAAEGEFSA